MKASTSTCQPLAWVAPVAWNPQLDASIQLRSGSVVLIDQASTAAKYRPTGREVPSLRHIAVVASSCNIVGNDPNAILIEHVVQVALPANK